MSGVNKVILLGHLGRDPELRYTNTQTPVCQLSIATSRSYKNRNGERVEDTEWHRVVVWGDMAKHCDQYLSKGRQVYVEGRMQTRSYDDKDGNKRYSTQVVAERVTFLGGGSKKNESRGAETQRRPDSHSDGHWNDNYIPSDPDDDIPF